MMDFDVLEVADGMVLDWPTTPLESVAPLLAEPTLSERTLGLVELDCRPDPAGPRQIVYFEPEDLLAKLWLASAYGLTEEEADHARQRARVLLAYAGAGAPLFVPPRPGGLR